MLSPETQQIAERYADLIKSQGLAKAYTVATGLQPVDLQAPAKNLYPVLTPLKASLPRISGGMGVSTQWKQVSAIIGSGNFSQGWVPEGQRTARMSITSANKSAAYVTLGEEDQASFEAISAGRGFADIQAEMAFRLLQQIALKEEDAVLGGNTGLALGTTPTPTLASVGSGGTLPTLTYDVVCIALTYEGYRLFSGAAGGTIAATNVITGADALTYTLNSGLAQKSAIAQQAITLPANLDCSVAPVRGAFGYAWFVGPAAGARFERVTTVNVTRFNAPLAGTGSLASGIAAADNSRNTVVPAFDGLSTAALISANGAYFKQLATGSLGIGTGLTNTPKGSIAEIDAMLLSMWNTLKLSPTVIYVNAQEQNNITNKVLTSSTTPLLSVIKSPGEPMAILANGAVEYYYNPFSLGGGFKIPVKIHPTLPPGTILAFTENLPVQYQSNNVPRVAEIRTRVDYYQLEWPIVTRQRQLGVYVEETLPIYFPAAMGIITNIENA